MIANFRFSSSWERFEEAVGILKDLLKRNKAHWLVGYLREFDIYIDEDEEEKLGEEILEIINSEILYLLYHALNEKIINAERIEEIILSGSEGASEDSVREAVMTFCNKCELAKDSFDIDELRKRYKLKKDSVNSKLSDFKYSIYTSNLSDGEKVNCAFINISSMKRLAGIQDKGNLLVNTERRDEVFFVCDHEDINMLIYQLESVKKKLEED